MTTNECGPQLRLTAGPSLLGISACAGAAAVTAPGCACGAAPNGVGCRHPRSLSVGASAEAAAAPAPPRPVYSRTCPPWLSNQGRLTLCNQERHSPCTGWRDAAKKKRTATHSDLHPSEERGRPEAIEEAIAGAIKYVGGMSGEGGLALPLEAAIECFGSMRGHWVEEGVASPLDKALAIAIDCVGGI